MPTHTTKRYKHTSSNRKTRKSSKAKSKAKLKSYPTPLSLKEYEKILDYYQYPYKEKELSPFQIRRQAEDILAKTLCKCIKHINKKQPRVKNEGRSIGLCTHSVFKRRGMKHSGFTCKHRGELLLPKTQQTRRKLPEWRIPKLYRSSSSTPIKI
jgi:hypothetical protein